MSRPEIFMMAFPDWNSFAHSPTLGGIRNRPRLERFRI